MATSTHAEQDLAALKTTVATISSLITQLQSTPSAVDSKGAKYNTVNALDLAYDTASLIKAHSTKLSLLIINKPFTPTAISTVLRALVSGPLPGLASAIEICNGKKYTKAMASELHYRAKKVLTELGTFVNSIPLDGKILSEDQKNGTGKEKGKGSLANTGVVWQACESLMELKMIGVAGLAIKKAEEYRDLLKDALEELKEWGEETSDDEAEDDGGNGSADEEKEVSAQNEIDKMFGSQSHISTDDPEKIRPRLESTQKKLKTLTILYQAVIKRRFKTLPSYPLPPPPPGMDGKRANGIALRLDMALTVMKQIPDIVDELANAFYELDGKDIDKRMNECFSKGFALAEILLVNWQEETDEFTDWATKFQEAIEKA